MKLAPIVLFVYNRLAHTQETVQALKANELSSESDLIIFSDGPRTADQVKNVENVRNYIKSITGFKSIRIIERTENLGLANSIIDGVTHTCEQYGKAIILEDDIVTSTYFLDYMNNSLNLYENVETVASIHAYTYPIDKLPNTFFLRGADCWGWATWLRGWKHFEPDGKKLLKYLQDQKLTYEFDLNGAYPFTKMLEDQTKGLNNSWAIRWHASCFNKMLFTLYPGQSLVHNIGLDNSGTHCHKTNIFDQITCNTPVHLEKIPIQENEYARQQFESFLRVSTKSTLKQKLKSFINKIKALINPLR